MARGVLELEAGIRSINTRKAVKSSTWLINLCLLPADHLLLRLDLKVRRKFKSPLQCIKQKYRKIKQPIIEKIRPYIIASWDPRIKYIKVEDFTTEPPGPGEARITSTAVKKSGTTAFGVTVSLHQFTVSVGAQVGNTKSQNPYTTELQALSIALESLAVQRSSLSAVIVITANLSVL